MFYSCNTYFLELEFMEQLESAIEVDARDVICLVLQYLHELGLTTSATTLSDETGIALPFIDALPGETVPGESVLAHVENGRWDLLLPLMHGRALPPTVATQVYKHVLCELCEAKDFVAARSLLASALPLRMLQATDPLEYQRLTEVSEEKRIFDPVLMYAQGSKLLGRQMLYATIAEHMKVVQPSRLMILLTQALKWQLHSGLLPANATKVDIFSGVTSLPRSIDDAAAQKSLATIKFGSAVYGTCAAFTPDGLSIVTGSLDGLIEVYDSATGRIRLDLPYQASDEFMMHDGSVTCCAVSTDGQLLASAAKDGMKVWHLATGTCLKKLPNVHSEGCTAIAFSPDSSHVVSGGYDGVVRVHGLRSGKLLKELPGHAGPVTAVQYFADGVTAASGSMDGSIRIWDTKAQTCVHTFHPPQTLATVDAPVATLMIVPKSAEHVLVVPNSGHAFLMTSKGAVIRTLSHPTAAPIVDVKSTATPLEDKSDAEIRASGTTHRISFVAGCVSTHGKHAYLAGDDGWLYVFSVASGLLQHKFPVLSTVMSGQETPSAPKSVLGVAQSRDGVVATWGTDSALRLWKAAL